MHNIHGLMAKLYSSKEAWLFAVICILILFASSLSDVFFTLGNFLNLIDDYVVMCIFSLGLVVVLISGGIDVSFPATASVAQYVVAVLFVKYGVDGAVAGILIAIAVGVLIGCLNTLFIHYMNVISIIVTISMQTLLFNLLMHLSKGRLIYDLPDWWMDYDKFAKFSLGGNEYLITTPMVVLFVLIILTSFLLMKTSLGRQLYAVGGNADAASRIGINVAGVRFFAYGFMGAIAAIGGLIQSHRMLQVVPNDLVPQMIDLKVLAAVVLGGASLMGGRGSVLGTIMGVMLLALIQNSLNLLGVSSYAFDIVIGIVMLAAVIITHISVRKNFSERVC